MVSVLVTLAGIFSTLIYLLFTHAALTPRRSNLCCGIVISAEVLASCFIRYLINVVPALKGWHTLFCFAMYLAAILFLYKDRLWKRILVWLLIFVVTAVAELASYAALQAVTSDAYAAITEFSFGQFIGTMIACAFETLIYTLILPVWRRVQKQETLKGILPLFLLPAGQVLVMLSILPQLRDTSYVPIVLWLTAAAQPFFFGTDIFWLFWVIGRSRRDETELALHIAQAAAAGQQEYFNQLKESSRAVAKLRHDYKNQLSAVSILLQQGKNEDAVHLLGELTDYLDATRTPVWCSHAVVNALLAKKSDECKAAGIRTEFSVLLPEQLPVTPMQLASVFGNLLDNAIRGASESESEEKSLQLKTECRGGYLFVVTVNPSPVPGALREGHGYGSVILRDLAESHGGAYLTEYKDGIFRATVTLKQTEES